MNRDWVPEAYTAGVRRTLMHLVNMHMVPRKRNVRMGGRHPVKSVRNGSDRREARFTAGAFTVKMSNP